MPPPPSSEPAVELDNVTFAYPGGPVVFRNVSITVPAGMRLGVFGPNGAGKTTLLKLILGFLHTASGAVRVFGHAPARAVRKGLIGYLPQRHQITWQAPLTVEQVASMSATAHLPGWRATPPDVRRVINAMLDLVGMADLRHRPIGALSGGQQQRVLIARALAARPRLIVFDEPTVGIDEEGRDRFSQLLNTIHREMDVTTMLVSHDLRVIRDVCDAIAVVARSLHIHTSPDGITPAVLNEVFLHDIVGSGSETASRKT